MLQRQLSVGSPGTQALCFCRPLLLEKCQKLEVLSTSLFLNSKLLGKYLTNLCIPLKTHRQIFGLWESIAYVTKHANFQLYRVHTGRVI